MKKLFNVLMLALVMTLSFSTIASAASAKPTKGTVTDMKGDSEITWKVTSLEVKDGVYEIRFDGKISKGFHGYPMSDFSAPIFFVGDREIAAAEISEPLAAQLVDFHGDKVYQGKAEYVFRVNGKDGDVVKGSIMATICSDKDNFCTQADHEFEVALKAAAAEVAATPQVSATPQVAEAQKPAEVEKAAEEVAEAVVDDEEAKEAENEAAQELVDARPTWVIKANMVDDDNYVISVATDVDDANINIVRGAKFYVNGEQVDIDMSEATAGETLEVESAEMEKGDVNTLDVLVIGGDNAGEYFEVSIVRAPSKSTTELDWSSIIAAILWGFAALLTPCVFPMVPMTVSFFVKGSQSPAQGRFRATMYGIFIVALYVLPIAAMIIISNFAGGNVTTDVFNWLSTHWVPNLIFFLIFMVFAASFFGAFEITMPSKLVNKSDAGAEKGGLVGIFFMALTLVLVSFSCTGPIVGTVLISSASGGNAWMPIFTMAAFAIAFALPFTLLAWFPSMLKNLPKSGGWLNSVKVVLGFIEIALGLKFLMTADQTYHWGLLDREVYLAIWIVTFTLLGFYLLGKLRFAHDDEVKHVSVKRLVMALAVFSFVVYRIPGMCGAPLKAISGYLPPMKTQDFRVDGKVENPNIDKKYGNILEIPHELEGYFDLDEAIAAAKEQDKPIFVDVTGHACNNCREMEASVWSNNKVLKYLEQDYIVCALYVDDKTELEEADYYTDANGTVQKELGRKNFAIAKERWGVTSQPGYVLVTPDGEAMLYPEPMGYERDIEKFANFLQSGLDNKQNGVTYAKEAPGVRTSLEFYDADGKVVKTFIFDKSGKNVVDVIYPEAK